MREVARVAAGLGDRARLLGVAAGERHVVLAVLRGRARTRVPHDPPPDDDDLHVRWTKSIETGTPARSKRSRSSFSTQ